MNLLLTFIIISGENEWNTRKIAIMKKEEENDESWRCDSLYVSQQQQPKQWRWESTMMSHNKLIMKPLLCRKF